MKESERYFRRNMAVSLLKLRTSTMVNGRQMLQQDVAEKADLSTRFYGKIERGDATPTVYTLTKIAGAFNLNLSELCRKLAL